MILTKNKKLTCLTSLSILGASMGSSVHAYPSWATPGSKIEKCAGVSAKGMNDCGANGHDCSGMAKIDNDKNEWIYTKAGECLKKKGKVIKEIDIPKEESSTKAK